MCEMSTLTVSFAEPFRSRLAIPLFVVDVRVEAHAACGLIEETFGVLSGLVKRECTRG